MPAWGQGHLLLRKHLDLVPHHVDAPVNKDRWGETEPRLPSPGSNTVEPASQPPSKASLHAALLHSFPPIGNT